MAIREGLVSSRVSNVIDLVTKGGLSELYAS